MSLLNGHKDVVVQVGQDGVRVDALSYQGFSWMRSMYGTVSSVFRNYDSAELGFLVSRMVADRLTVEVRHHEAA